MISNKMMSEKHAKIKHKFHGQILLRPLVGFFKLNSVLAQILGAPFQSDWIKCINQISYIEYTQSCDWL